MNAIKKQIESFVLIEAHVIGRNKSEY